MPPHAYLFVNDNDGWQASWTPPPLESTYEIRLLLRWMDEWEMYHDGVSVNVYGEHRSALPPSDRLPNGAIKAFAHFLVDQWHEMPLFLLRDILGRLRRAGIGREVVAVPLPFSAPTRKRDMGRSGHFRPLVYLGQRDGRWRGSWFPPPTPHYYAVQLFLYWRRELGDGVWTVSMKTYREGVEVKAHHPVRNQRLPDAAVSEFARFVVECWPAVPFLLLRDILIRLRRAAVVRG